MNNKYIFLIILVGLLLIVLLLLFNRVCKKVEKSTKFTYGLDENPDNYIEPIEIPNLLTEEECNYIISISRDKLKDATVGGGRTKMNSVRNNKVAWIDVNSDNPIINKIYDKINKMTGATRDYCESMQIAHYGQNEFYRHHYDQCHDFDTNNDCKILLEECGYKPRKYTMLIYLNKDYEDGHTDFPNISKKYRPKNIGDAILFNSLNNDNTMVHKYSLHSGTDVTKGEKWIANVWIHTDKIR